MLCFVFRVSRVSHVSRVVWRLSADGMREPRQKDGNSSDTKVSYLLETEQKKDSVFQSDKRLATNISIVS